MIKDKAIKSLIEALKKWPPIHLGNATNLKGQKFGELYPYYRTKNTSGLTSWVCICSCGKYIKVIANNLKRNHTRSCGHLQNGKFIDRTNIIINDCLFLERTSRLRSSEVIWKCKNLNNNHIFLCYL